MEFTFKLLKNSQEEIVGFSLVAGAETHSEIFCEFMGTEIRNKGTTVIKVEPEKITFVGPDRSHSVKIGRKEADALKLLLAAPKKLGLYPEPFSLTAGFRIVLIEEKDLVSV